MSEELSSLKKMVLFTYLNEEELKAVREIITEVDYMADKSVFEESQDGHTLYLIKSGEVKVTKKDPEGTEQVLALLKEGDIFGEMSFLDGRPHSATVVAVHSTRILQIEKGKFDEFVDSHPKAAYKIMKTIVIQVDAIVRRMNTNYVDMLSYMFGRRRF
ncbi:MAG: cyclic nucleotide-binding domain-containing protein [Proteobacteria bacterium]|nr:cyclic nucleotide-binding domain-containing protein [Pseudomonadota bacterium]